MLSLQPTILSLLLVAATIQTACVTPHPVDSTDQPTPTLEEPGLPGEFFETLARRWPTNRTINIVFHGHSVPAGYHRTPEVKPFESYPHLVIRGLKERYPHAVINGIVTAIGGESADRGAARFASDVITHKPDLIFIDYALNDRRLTPEQTRQAWFSMLQMAREHQISIVFLTPTGSNDADSGNPRDPLNLRADLIRELAASEHVLVADIFQAWKDELAKGTPQNELLSQVNHPNLRGHTLAAEVILKLLDTEAARTGH